MVSKSEIIVRYAETDQMGIAHHSNYAIWYEVARTDMINKIGMTYSQMEEQGVLVPLLELHSQYISPAYYEDKLTVEARIIKLTPVKIEFEYVIYKQGIGEPIHKGRTLHALVGKDLKPMNIRKMHSQIYEKLLGALT